MVKDSTKRKTAILFMKLASDAQNPFQFIANVVSLESILTSMPIKQDASSSAYQIISYKLFDIDNAQRTNFLQNEKEFNDLYTRETFFEIVIEKSLKFSRKLVKKIYIQLFFYGQRMHSSASYIKQSLEFIIAQG
jgi:hypothetical protein